MASARTSRFLRLSSMKSDVSRSVTFCAATGTFRDVADAERVALDELHLNVRAHPLDDVLHRRLRLLCLVEVQVADDSFEARAAQKLLAEALKSIFDARRHRRLDVALRHPLRNDHDQRARAIPVGETVQDGDCRDAGEENRDHNDEQTPLENTDDVVERVCPAWKHRGSQRISRVLSVSPTRTVCRSSVWGRPSARSTGRAKS